MAARKPPATPAKKSPLQIVPPAAAKRRPTVAPVGPVPPDYLDADALDVWHRVAPLLGDKLLPTDVDLFAAFCTAVVHHRRAVRLVNATNVLIKAAGHDHVVKHPALQIVRDQMTLMLQAGARFGLTPADRAALAKDDGDGEGDDGDGWLTAGLSS